LLVQYAKARKALFDLRELLCYRYVNSMPLVFAFRVVDCFFCMGPKVLFQVG
jgi:hypothetical protein